MTGQQLKNSILQMAVQGKLVPQDPNDEPASVLIERIREEKQRLIKEGKIKKEKNPSYIFRGEDNMPYEKIGNNDPVCIADEVPFDIPESWEWMRLGSLTYNHGQKKPENNFCYIDIGSIDNNSQKLADTENILSAKDAPSRARKIVQIGDILYSTVRPYLHNMCIVDKEFSCEPIASTGFAVLTTYADYNNEFLFFYMLSPDFDMYANCSENSKGVAYPAINDERLSKALIPIPPLAEQKKIINYIRLLLPQIEKYKIKEEKLTQLNTDFPEKLKKSVLQMAIQGKLVEQNPSDEPAKMLLQAIKNEKDTLIKAGKIKKDKNESIIYCRDNSYYEKIGNEERCIDDEIPFDIPESWEWCRLSQLTTKDIKRGKSPKYSETGSVYVFAQKCNVKAGGINLKLAKHIDMSTLDKYPESEYLVDGDIVINSTGNGTLGRIGIFRDFDRIDNCIIVPDSHVTVVRINPQICIEYILAALKAYQPFLEGLGEGSTNQTELKPITVSNLLIPVPPYQEQERIAYNLKIVMELNSSLQE